MKTIHKFPIEIKDNQIVKMPERAKILSVQMQNGIPCIWAQVDTIQDLKDVYISVYGTGHPIGEYDEIEFIGTVQIGPLVFHVYRGF